jgi:hypothetical protein
MNGKSLAYVEGVTIHVQEVIVDRDGAIVDLFRSFLSRQAAFELFKTLKSKAPWEQETVRVRRANFPP